MNSMAFARFLILLLVVSLSAPAAEPVNDSLLYDLVRLKLTRDADVQGGAMEVKVTDGVVELSGNVLRQKQKDRAAKLAAKVKGVKKVVNNLKVAPIR